MSFHDPNTMSSEMINFLSGSPRLTMTSDMPLVLRGISSFSLLSKLLGVYVYAPQNESPSLVFYSKRNLDAIKQFLTSILTPEIQGNLDEHHMRIFDDFLNGETPMATTSEIKQALHTVGWNENSNVDVLQEDGSVKSEKVLVNYQLGADPWMIEHLGSVFEMTEIDPQDFKFSQLLVIYRHCVAPLPEMQLEEADLDVYTNTVSKWSRQWGEILYQTKFGVTTSEERTEFLQDGNLNGTSALETIIAIKAANNNEPVSDSLRTAIEMYTNMCAANVQELNSLATV
jgi:hypothetical protein